jgi:hypothetical protein
MPIVATPSAVSSVLQFSEVVAAYAERKIVRPVYDASYPRNRDRAAQVNVGRQAATARRYLGELAEAREELERMIGEYGERVGFFASLT